MHWPTENWLAAKKLLYYSLEHHLMALPQRQEQAKSSGLHWRELGYHQRQLHLHKLIYCLFWEPPVFFVKHASPFTDPLGGIVSCARYNFRTLLNLITQQGTCDQRHSHTFYVLWQHWSSIFGGKFGVLLYNEAHSIGLSLCSPQKGQLQVTHVKSSDQLDDALTKSLPKSLPGAWFNTLSIKIWLA